MRTNELRAILNAIAPPNWLNTLVLMRMREIPGRRVKIRRDIRAEIMLNKAFSLVSTAVGNYSNSAG